MPDTQELVIKDFPGIEDRTTAEQLAEEARFDNPDSVVELIEEPDGTFTIRIYPPGFDPELAMNVGAAATETSAGAPATPATGGVKGLLDFIARFESGGNYNAFFRHSGNQNNPKFTQMTLANVVKWQRNHTQVNGSPSSAAGRYQVIRKTLEGLIDSIGLDPVSDRFTMATQDQLAVKLLEEKGLKTYLAGGKSATAFANDVSRVWAALPIVTNDYKDAKGRKNRKGFSFYAGDGLNKSHVGADSYLRAVKAAKA